MDRSTEVASCHVPDHCGAAGGPTEQGESNRLRRQISRSATLDPPRVPSLVLSQSHAGTVPRLHTFPDKNTVPQET